MSTIRVSVRRKRIAYDDRALYVARPVLYSCIDTEELIELVSMNCCLPRGLVSAVFYALEQEFRQLLLNGHSVQCGILGTFRYSFSCKASESREGVTADGIRMHRIIYTPSKRLKREMKALQFVGFAEGDVPPQGPEDEAVPTDPQETGAEGENAAADVSDSGAAESARAQARPSMAAALDAFGVPQGHWLRGVAEDAALAGSSGGLPWLGGRLGGAVSSA